MYSNLKVLDSTNRPKAMIEYANQIGLHGICLTDHEILSGHVKMIQEYKKLKEESVLREGFKIGLGNEIYLVEEEDIDTLKENVSNRNPDTKFYHFLLLATNLRGHQQLRELSSIAYSHMFTSFGMDRTPTFKSDLKRVIQKGDVIASTACIGGIVGQSILSAHRAKQEGDVERHAYYIDRLKEFLDFCVDVFGKDNFYLEIQPSDDDEQIVVNRFMIDLSEETGIKYVIATDGHYLTKNDRHAHRTYLQSRQAEREVDAFYSATYIMSEQEIREYMTYLPDSVVDEGFKNTIEIYNKIEQYDLFHETIIPKPYIQEFEFKHILEEGYEQYPYIKKFAFSEYEIDRYYLHLVQQGLIEMIVIGRNADKEYFHKCLDRINTELRELWLISDRLGDRMSAYYVLTKDVIDLIWEDADSLTGISRGSAGGYLTSFLLKIIQMNPLDWDLPHFRHLTAERVELPDIDNDCEAAKRLKIIEELRKKYGQRNVLNIATFSTEGSRSALLSAARGMGIDTGEVSYLTSLIPVERGFTWNLKDCFFGNEKEDRKPVKELVNAVNQHEGLMDVALSIEGLIKGRSQHASGVYIFPEEYHVQNAMMKTSSGLMTTQFDMSDSDYLGGLKIDLLTVEAIDKIRVCMDLLLENGLIEDKGSLRKTYNAYLHPDKLDYTTPEMWEKVAENKIPDLFQFDSPVGMQCAKKTKPKSIEELAAANSLMRLMSDGEEQPIDRYIRHKENPNQWLQEMRDYNLTEEEIKLVQKHLASLHGVSDSQESIMLILMDEDIGGMTIPEADYVRKVIGRKLMSEIPKVKEMFFNKEAT